MSTTIDQNVVEMRFDNRHFEQNVSQSMSTLNKFKQSLNFDGATKGIESVGTATEAVSVKVSHAYAAMQAQIVRWATNISQTIEKTIDQLTTAPIRTGFSEYETQINATQTILANTKSKGSDINDVNKALEELNRYADLTIYNFTEMTRNIGTFTAAGIDLDTSVNAIQGIANLAAVSGSTSQQASTAMYQLSQALAAGTIRLMDWNSVVNAGMGGEIFQNALRETSEELNTGAEAAIKASGSFRESLKNGWLTADVLTATLKKFTTSGANEYVAKYTNLSIDAVEAAVKEGEAAAAAAKANGEEADAINLAAEALAEKSGKNKQEIYDMLDFARVATDAATKVKTFTQLWDVLKEAAQSGWAQSWKIIVGDFEKAKDLLTPLADVLTGFINDMSDARNRVLTVALAFTDPIKTMMDKLNGAGLGKIKETINAVGDLTDKLEYYQDVVNRVWRGDYNNVGDNPDRYDLLTGEGYDPRIVQDLVNKGYQYKLTVHDIEASYAKFGVAVGQSNKAVNKSNDALSESKYTLEGTGNAIRDVNNAYNAVSDEKLKDLGLTEEEIRLYRALGKEAERLNISVYELADEMSEKDGRTLLIESLTNFGDIITGIGKAAATAWEEIFNPPTLEYLGVRIHTALRSLKEFSEGLRLTDADTGKLNANGLKFQRIFKGVFAVLDIITTILGGGLKFAFKTISAIIGKFDVDVLELAAGLGDALVAFRDWLYEGNLIAKSFNWMLDQLPVIVDCFKAWFDVFKDTPAVQKFIEAFTAIGDAFNKLFNGEIDASEFAASLGENLAKALKALPEIAIQIGSDFIAGFQNGIGDGFDNVIKDIVDCCLSFVAAFAEALGVQSPSWKAYETATDFFQGFINGTGDMIGAIAAALRPIGEQVVDIFRSLWDFITDENGQIEWGKLFAGGSIVSFIWVLKELIGAWKGIATAFNGIAEAIGGFGDLVEGCAKVLKSFSKVLDGVAWDLKAQALLKFAGAIAILVAAVWVLTTIDDPTKVWKAVNVIIVLAAILVGLSIAMDKLSSAGVSLDGKTKQLDIKGIQSSIIQIGLALMMVAAAAMMIGNMDPDAAKRGFIGLAGVAVGMVVFMAAMGGISRYSKDVGGIGGMMAKMATAMILLAIACKIIGMLSDEDIGKGVVFAGAFAIFVMAITTVAKSAGNNVSKVGGMVVKLTVAMLLLVGICKLIGMLSAEDMLTAVAFIIGFTIFVGALVDITKIGKKQQIAKLGGLVISISTSLLLMVGVCKLVGMLSTDEMIKGALFTIAFGVMLKCMMDILKIGNDQKIAKVTGTILAISTAIGIMAAVAALMSFIPLADLAKGVVAVGILGAVMALMIHGLKGAQNAKDAIMNMAIAVGVMAASVAVLSFIPKEDLYAAAGALALVMAAFALMINGLRGMKNVKMGPLIALSGVVVILAGILFVLKDTDPTSAIGTAVSLALLMLSMSAVLKIIGTMPDVKGALKGVLGLLALAVPMLAFSIILRQMNGIENATTNANMLVELMGTMTILLGILSAVGAFLSAGIIPGVLGLTAMIVPMLAFVWALKEADGIEDASGKIEALTVAMTAMTILLGVLAVIGLGGPAAIIGIGSLVALFVAIGGLAVAIGALMESFPNIKKFLDEGLPVLEDLAGSIGTMIGNFIGGIREGLSDSLVKMGEDFAEFTDKLALASENATGVKVESFSGVKALMEIIADIAGAAVGTNISDIGSLLTSGKTSFDSFAEDGVAFFNAMATIGEASSKVDLDVESFETIVSAAERLSKLSDSIDPIGGIMTFFSGRTDLETFGTNASAFVTSMIGIFESTDGAKLNIEQIESVIGAATSLADLQTKLEPIGGVIAFFTGRDDLATFGINIAEFMVGMKTALEEVAGVTLDEVALSAVIDATSKLADLQTKLEPIGGVVTWFTGRDDLSEFGTNIAAFITSMKTALETLDGTVPDDAALTSVITAASKLADLQSKLEPMGGVVTWFTGRDDLGEFGTNIGLFATAMGTLKAELGEDGITENVVDSVTNAGNAIIALQEALPEDTWFDGKMSLSKFSEYITDFAEALGIFNDEITDINASAVTVALNAAHQIRILINAVADIDTSGVSAFTGVGTGGFGADGPAYKIAQAMTAFSDEVININPSQVNTAVSTAQTLAELISDLSDLDTSGAADFKDALNNLVSVNSSALASAFSNVAGKLKTSGAEMVSSIITGMRNKMPMLKAATIDMVRQLADGMLKAKTSINTAWSSCLTSSLSVINLKYLAFYNAGSYLVTGFANGISANAYRAVAKAVIMANMVEQAARNALGINSPSKVFQDIGAGIPEGFAMGINTLGGTVDESVTNMASTAIDSARSTMGSILDALSGEMEAQPTIRPVIDLSDVKTGIGAISGMFDGVQGVGVQANIGAVTTMMNRNGQNGRNADVVSALDKLNRKMDNIGNTTYQINGVTYDDGSNIASAVQTITRAALRERRV